ncbi:hypothetical protein QE152_g16052 [Popillia japonica]|uniref:Uncharacterized protein n=1 Tax=Popillia japonica TaxID=7064 RepID=A0AAW1L6F8_POPJA
MEKLKAPSKITRSPRTSDADLKESIARILTTTNPKEPYSLVEYNHKIGEFVVLPTTGNLVAVFEGIGTYIHNDSEHPRELLTAQCIGPFAFDQTTEAEDEISTQMDTIDEAKGEEGACFERTTEKKLTNQINFSERAALTYNNPVRCQETQTTAPPMATFSANVLQWVIYDGYLGDCAAQELEKLRKRERKEKEKILFDDESDNQDELDVPDESDLEDEDQVETREENSDTEQSNEECNSEESDCENYLARRQRGKDKTFLQEESWENKIC